MTLTEGGFVNYLTNHRWFMSKGYRDRFSPFSLSFSSLREKIHLSSAWTFRKGSLLSGLQPSTRWNPSSMNIKHFERKKVRDHYW